MQGQESVLNLVKLFKIGKFKKREGCNEFKTKIYIEFEYFTVMNLKLKFILFLNILHKFYY